MNAEEFISNRTAAGLTQAEMAKSLGLSIRQVRRYESGESAVPKPVSEVVTSRSRSSDVFRDAIIGMRRAAVAAEDRNHPMAGDLRDLAEKTQAIIREMQR